MLLVGYTLRVACRLGASTGCWGGLCPFPCTPILSHIYRAAHRCSPYNTILYARYAAYARLRYAMPWRAGSSVCGGFFMGEYGRIWENMGILAACVRRISGRYSAWAADAAKCCRLTVPCVLLPVRSGNRPSVGFARHPILSHTLSYSPISIAAAHRCSSYNTIPPTDRPPCVGSSRMGSAIGMGKQRELEM